MRPSGNSRPVVVLVLLIALVGGVVTIFQLRTNTLVRAPGILYPKAYVDLLAPAAFGQVVKVYKKDGDLLKEDDEILKITDASELLMRAEVQARMAGYKEELKEHESMRKERIARTELARVAVHEAEQAIEVEKARLDQAQALLKRAGPEPTQLEIQVAKAAYEYAGHTEEETRITYENYQVLYAKNAVTEDALRLAKLAHAKAITQVGQTRDQLALLSSADTVLKLEDAQAQVAYRQATVKSAEATVEARKKEVQVLELAEDIDAAEKQLQAALEQAKLEDQRLEQEIALKVLRAPIPGILTNFHVTEGEYMINRRTVGTIHDVSQLIFNAHVEQRDMGRVKPGQQALVYFDGVPNGGFKAEVLDVSPVATPPPSLIGEPQGLWTNPRVPTIPRALVRLKMLEGDTATLHVGFTGQVKILIQETPSAWTKLFF